MTIIQYITDGLTLGYKILVFIKDWLIPILTGVIVGFFQTWYPYNLIILTGGTIMTIKMILRGFK